MNRILPNDKMIIGIQEKHDKLFEMETIIIELTNCSPSSFHLLLPNLT